MTVNLCCMLSIKKRIWKIILFIILFIYTGCTTIDVALLPDKEDIFITAGDITQPYEPLGMIFVSKSNLRFLYIPIRDVSLDMVLHNYFIPQVRKLGADGVIKVGFRHTSVGLTDFIYMPFGGDESVEIWGLAVKLKREKK